MNRHDISSRYHQWMYYATPARLWKLWRGRKKFWSEETLRDHERQWEQFRRRERQREMRVGDRRRWKAGSRRDPHVILRLDTLSDRVLVKYADRTTDWEEGDYYRAQAETVESAEARGQRFAAQYRRDQLIADQVVRPPGRMIIPSNIIGE